MSHENVEIAGHVTQEVINRGSKSEHDAVVLRTPKGQLYVLRRVGGPAFFDPVLKDLVGQSILAEGVSTRDVLFLRSWTLLADSSKVFQQREIAGQN